MVIDIVKSIHKYLCDQHSGSPAYFLKGLSQISSGARTASKNCYLSHIILLTVRAPGLICESPFSEKESKKY